MKILLILLLATPAMAAEQYKCDNGKGVVYYQTWPCDAKQLAAPTKKDDHLAYIYAAEALKPGDDFYEKMDKAAPNWRDSSVLTNSFESAGGRTEFWEIGGNTIMVRNGVVQVVRH